MSYSRTYQFRFPPRTHYFQPRYYRNQRIMGGLFAAAMGGLIGYHLAKERYADPASPAYRQSWTSAWSDRCEQRRAERWAQIPAAAAASKGQADAAANDNEYAAFLKWKAAQQSPPYVDTMRAGAVENADKALDAVMAQVQVLKEKLAQHKGVAPQEKSTVKSPQTEAGGFNFV